MCTRPSFSGPGDEANSCSTVLLCSRTLSLPLYYILLIIVILYSLQFINMGKIWSILTFPIEIMFISYYRSLKRGSLPVHGIEFHEPIQFSHSRHPRMFRVLGCCQAIIICMNIRQLLFLSNIFKVTSKL